MIDRKSIIDSGVPTVTCGTDSISIAVPTDKPFLGRIFVKGLSKKPECFKEFYNNSLPLAMMDLKLTACGMRRERKVE